MLTAINFKAVALALCFDEVFNLDVAAMLFWQMIRSVKAMLRSNF